MKTAEKIVAKYVDSRHIEFQDGSYVTFLPQCPRTMAMSESMVDAALDKINLLAQTWKDDRPRDAVGLIDDLIKELGGLD